MKTKPTNSIPVSVYPGGMQIYQQADETLLAALQYAGIMIKATCSGAGSCGACRVRILDGECIPLTAVEQRHELPDDQRLACQVRALGPLKIEIPAESLYRSHQLQSEGSLGGIVLNPRVVKQKLTISGNQREFVKVAAQYQDTYGCELALTDELKAKCTQILAEDDFKEIVFLQRQGIKPCIIDCLSKDMPLYGMAVDVGTTKLALYLVSMENGGIVFQDTALNPQIRFGEDVISRIAWANKGSESLQQLRDELVKSLNGLLDRGFTKTGIHPDQIVDAVLVGNTAMHHIMAGLPPLSLGVAPFQPVTTDAVDMKVSDFPLSIHKEALIYLPANIAGFLGGDHAAALVSTGFFDRKTAAVLIDIGTNTEISLIHAGKVFSCSTASGPAFEGGQIRNGMRAQTGAIDSVKVNDNKLKYSVIGEGKPSGICGTGILSAIASFLDADWITASGKPVDSNGKTTDRIQLADENVSHIGREISVFRKDIQAVLLAKGAIRTGIDVLLNEAGINKEEIEEWIIAGAFGTYLDPLDALRIGMLPDVNPNIIQQVGNAAGMGAVMLLMDETLREDIQSRVRLVNDIELMTWKGFMDLYVENLKFPGKLKSAN